MREGSGAGECGVGVPRPPGLPHPPDRKANADLRGRRPVSRPQRRRDPVDAKLHSIAAKCSKLGSDTRLEQGERRSGAGAAYGRSTGALRRIVAIRRPIASPRRRRRATRRTAAVRGRPWGQRRASQRGYRAGRGTACRNSGGCPGACKQDASARVRRSTPHPLGCSRTSRGRCARSLQHRETPRRSRRTARRLPTRRYRSDPDVHPARQRRAAGRARRSARPTRFDPWEASSPPELSCCPPRRPDLGAHRDPHVPELGQADRAKANFPTARASCEIGPTASVIASRPTNDKKEAGLELPRPAPVRR